MDKTEKLSLARKKVTEHNTVFNALFYTYVFNS